MRNDTGAEQADGIQREFATTAGIRVLAAYLFFNVGLLLPVLILNLSHAFSLQPNLEVTVLFAIWGTLGTRWGKRGLQRFTLGFSLFYLTALVYSIYAAAVYWIYQIEANFFNDASFVLGNIAFLFDAAEFPFWVFLAGGTGVIALICLVFWAARITFLDRSIAGLPGSTRLAMAGFVLSAVLLGGFLSQTGAASRVPVNSFTAEIIANIQRSIALRENLNALVAVDPTEFYDYSAYPLTNTPDIYFIFVESYGSVLYQKPGLASPYLEMAERFEGELENNGWSVVSAISEAPVRGGGSWMSYTSTMFGVQLDREVQYDALREKYSALEYPHIGRYFSSQGYAYLWATSVDRQLPADVMKTDRLFYGADRWITYETMLYTGPMLGWGPSVPDQFSLGFIQEYVTQQEQPVFSFFLTQNLHYPWAPLPPVMEDWRDLAHSAQGEDLLRGSQIVGGSWEADYLNALDNTLLILGKFITSLENENSIIVLIGDHQPPGVSHPEDGFGTMVHIISRDADLLTSYGEFGFVNGMVLENIDPALRHEGLYSLFIRNLVRQYGENPLAAPEYLPDGIH